MNNTKYDCTTGIINGEEYVAIKINNKDVFIPSSIYNNMSFFYASILGTDFERYTLDFVFDDDTEIK